jgi:GNAT superfamily N-acetyltransferase
MTETSLSLRTLNAADAADSAAAVAVINTAAAWYAEFLPPAEVEDPEMTLGSFREEALRMTWYGAFSGDELVGVMGLEYVGDAALFRHAYVLPAWQRRGVAAKLHGFIEPQITGVTRIIIGTYEANYQARGALEKGGYRLSQDSEAVLRRYYDIPEERLSSSVTYEKDFEGEE